MPRSQAHRFPSCQDGLGMAKPRPLVGRPGLGLVDQRLIRRNQVWPVLTRA